MKKTRKNSKGQAIVEYIIIIVIVAVAALTVMGVFSDRIRTIIAGVATTFGAEDASSAISTSSADVLKGMSADGIDTGTGG
ncbi:MAG: hypothetical protein A2017_07830 [Lentisphaerae bacterium GWF2_44_16]|nr:MAG: hypothetical protein A2017_07830 [Lentisphaerae bacterium GWF2_44_16]